MDENKQKKVALTGQVRLPEWLDREIDMEASELGVFKYEVVEKAWEVYRVVNYDDEPTTISEGSPLLKSRDAKGDGTQAEGFSPDAGGDVLQLPVDDLSREEKEWFHRLLRILRSGSTTVHNALSSNFHVFEEALEYEREHHTHEPEIGAGKPVRAKGINAAIAEADRLAGRTHEALQRSKNRAGKHARKDRKRG